MTMLLLEVEGLNLVIRMIQSILDEEDKDSPLYKRSESLLEQCNEILENYIGIDNDFSSPALKGIYNELIIDLLDEIIGKNIFLSLRTKKIRNIQLCEENSDRIILFIGDINGRE